MVNHPLTLSSLPSLTRPTGQGQRHTLRVRPSPPSLHTLTPTPSAGLADAFGDPITGLYTANASAPLGAQAGLRPLYQFGLYSFCAYVDGVHGTCSNHSVAAQFQPYDAITADMFQNYSRFTDAIVLNTTFRDSAYLGSLSKAAYYMLLLGTLCAALALLT